MKYLTEGQRCSICLISLDSPLVGITDTQIPLLQPQNIYLMILQLETSAHVLTFLICGLLKGLSSKGLMGGAFGRDGIRRDWLAQSWELSYFRVIAECPMRLPHLHLEFTLKM